MSCRYSCDCSDCIEERLELSRRDDAMLERMKLEREAAALAIIHEHDDLLVELLDELVRLQEEVRTLREGLRKALSAIGLLGLMSIEDREQLEEMAGFYDEGEP